MALGGNRRGIGRNFLPAIDLFLRVDVVECDSGLELMSAAAGKEALFLPNSSLGRGSRVDPTRGRFDDLPLAQVFFQTSSCPRRFG